MKHTPAFTDGTYSLEVDIEDGPAVTGHRNPRSDHEPHEMQVTGARLTYSTNTDGPPRWACSNVTVFGRVSAYK